MITPTGGELLKTALCFPSCLLAVLSLAACGVTSDSSIDSNTPLPLAEVRDSSGVRIVEYETFRNVPERMALSDSGTLVYGGLMDEDSLELSSKAPFVDAAPLYNGGFAVTDWDHVKILDRKGAYLARRGKHGDGPGEFRQARMACVMWGDTLLVFGYSDRRVTQFSPDGRILASFSLGGSALPGTCRPDGSFIVAASTGATAGAERLVSLTLVDALGSEVRSLGMHPGPDYKVDPPLELWVNVIDSVFVAGNGRHFEFRTFRMNGTLLQVVRSRDEVAVIDAEQAERTIKGRTPRNSSPENAARIRAMTLSTVGQRPSAYPSLALGKDGRVYMRENTVPGERPTYLVFGADGALQGRLTGPGRTPTSRSEIVRFLDSTVVVVTDNVLEGKAIHRFRIIR